MASAAQCSPLKLTTLHSPWPNFAQATATLASASPLDDFFHAVAHEPSAVNASAPQRSDLADGVCAQAVAAVKSPDPKSPVEPEVRSLAATLRDGLAGAEFDAYRAALQKQVGVKTYSELPES